MKPLVKTLLSIFKLGLFLLAVILSILNMDERYNTNKTTTKTWNMDLSEIFFPLKFSLLINPGFVKEKLEHAGYQSDYNVVENYFRGEISSESEHQGSLGWAGNTLGTVSGIKQHIDLLYR